MGVGNAPDLHQDATVVLLTLSSVTWVTSASDLGFSRWDQKRNTELYVMAGIEGWKHQRQKGEVFTSAVHPHLI